MKLRSTLFIFLLSYTTLFSQAFFGGGGAIDDTGQLTVFTLNVTGLSPSTIDGSFGLERVCIDVIHPFVSDLTFWVKSPDGTQVLLSSGNGSDGDDYSGTCFDPGSSISIIAGSAPFPGSYIPEGSLAQLNNGQIGNGEWQLIFEDTYPNFDAGTLLSWSLTFGNQPAVPFEFESSNLPIFVINTQGQEILDDPKVMVELGIIYNGPGIRNYITDPFNEYNGYAGIEIRGNSSAMFDKKGYGLETWDSLGNDIDVSILGFPAEEDWILNGPYSDKSLMRNALTMKIGREAGQYASRTAYCELLINGDYRGLYILMEKIKRDEGRLDISKLRPDDIAGNELTGGYIFKVDKSSDFGWYSNYDVLHSPGTPLEFSFYTPDIQDIKPQQAQYIQSYMDSFELAIASPSFEHPSGKRYDEFINLRSFAQNFLINELSKNIDGYRLSTYFYKKKLSNGGQVFAGPIWDFNLGYGNANYCNAEDVTGWVYEDFCDNHNPFWWEKMLTDTRFQNLLKCEWVKLRGDLLHTDSIMAYLDSTTNYVEEAAERNFTRWPILGTYVWPNPFPFAVTHQEEVNTMKSYIQNRISWMDANMPGVCVSPDPLLVEVMQQSDVDCYGNTNGSIEFGVSGGISEYYYDWPDSFSGTQAQGLAPGSYSVIVHDGFDLVDSLVFEILEPDSLSFTFNSLPSVNQNCNGELSVLPSGGTGPYSYQWDSAAANQVTATAGNLCVGQYCVTVTDSNGCQFTDCFDVQNQIVGLDSEIRKEALVRFWPNPSGGLITLDIISDKVEKWELFDAQGKKVSESKSIHPMSGQRKLDLSGLSVGIYFLRISTEFSSETHKVQLQKK